MSLPVDLKNVPNAVFNSILIALHIPSIIPVKTLRLISVGLLCFWLGFPLFLFQELVVVNDTFCHLNCNNQDKLPNSCQRPGVWTKFRHQSLQASEWYLKCKYQLEIGPQVHILSTWHAHPQTMYKTSEKFQKGQSKKWVLVFMRGSRGGGMGSEPTLWKIASFLGS